MLEDGRAVLVLYRGKRAATPACPGPVCFRAKRLSGHLADASSRTRQFKKPAQSDTQSGSSCCAPVNHKPSSSVITLLKSTLTGYLMPPFTLFHAGERVFRRTTRAGLSWFLLPQLTPLWRPSACNSGKPLFHGLECNCSCAQFLDRLVTVVFRSYHFAVVTVPNHSGA